MRRKERTAGLQPHNLNVAGSYPAPATTLQTVDSRWPKPSWLEVSEDFPEDLIEFEERFWGSFRGVTARAD